jgi:hypothetical protein
VAATIARQRLVSAAQSVNVAAPTKRRAEFVLARGGDPFAVMRRRLGSAGTATSSNVAWNG